MIIYTVETEIAVGIKYCFLGSNTLINVMPHVSPPEGGGDKGRDFNLIPHLWG